MAEAVPAWWSDSRLFSAATFATDASEVRVAMNCETRSKVKKRTVEALQALGMPVPPAAKS